MKSDLEKANEALTGGRADEASVYAWNALAGIGSEDASELARIARELDDRQLLREIERRGCSRHERPNGIGPATSGHAGHPGALHTSDPDRVVRRLARTTRRSEERE